MLIKLRGDIKDIFSSVNTILVNKRIFDQSENGGIVTEYTWEYSAENLLKELQNHGVTLKFYKRENIACSFIKQNINLIKHNSHTLHTLDGVAKTVNAEKYMIITCDPADTEMIRKSVFSIVSSSSPLEIKMFSSYVSNFDSINMFQEIGNIVIRSR